MKIRNPRLIKAAGWLGSQLIQGLVRTLQVETHVLGSFQPPMDLVEPGRRICAGFWHEILLLPAAYYGHPDLSVLISKHADGQLLAALIRSMGMGLVFGSTNRGGIEAVREIVAGNDGRPHIAITVDGPRGPRRVVQPGIVYIASRCGMELVPSGAAFQHAWRLNSWDRFAIPRPGTRAKMIYGVPIKIPPKARSQELEMYRDYVQKEIERLTSAAETWARTNRLILDAPIPIPGV